MMERWPNNRGAVLINFLKLALVASFLVICRAVLPPMLEAGAWILSGSRWTEQDEKIYENVVRSLGESGYGNVNRFIRDPKVNPLFGEEDKKFSLSPDCADLPYVMRAYVAYKLRLPFTYVNEISSRGGDQRYSYGNRPQGTKDQDSFSSPQSFFSNVTLVNSGFYRMAPEVKDSDTFPVKILASTIVPGTIYYDPNGHVALVYQVTDDGRIRLIDAHPDRSLSRPWFGPKFAIGGRNQGGGFRRWRPIWYSSDGQTHRQDNINIPEFSESDQYQSNFQFQGLNGLSYFDYVRFKLSSRGGQLNPLEEFRQSILEIFEDLKYRVDAVEICVKNGINRKEHPGSLPYNIYGTDGEWEQFSTPSRDARLKVAFLELFNRTMQMISMAQNHDPNLLYSGSPEQLASEFLRMYDYLNPSLTISYKNSAGGQVVLTFNDILQRLFFLSFDPYHSPEFRWGASGSELSASPDGPLKQKMYKMETRLRNQLERLYNCATGYNLGPENPPDVNVRQWLVNFLSGRAKPVISSKSAPAGVSAAEPIGAQQGASMPAEMMNSPLVRRNPEKEMNKFAASFFSKLDDVATDFLAWNIRVTAK